METTTLANVAALLRAPYTSDNIEDGGVESPEEESIVVPSTVMLDDEQSQFNFAGLGRVILVDDHGGNQRSDVPSHDPINHNDDRGSDSTFRVSAAALLTEQEQQEVIMQPNLDILDKGYCRGNGGHRKKSQICKHPDCDSWPVDKGYCWGHGGQRHPEL
jgi:hypothetical protein